MKSSKEKLSRQKSTRNPVNEVVMMRGKMILISLDVDVFMADRVSSPVAARNYCLTFSKAIVMQYERH